MRRGGGRFGLNPLLEWSVSARPPLTQTVVKKLDAHIYWPHRKEGPVNSIELRKFKDDADDTIKALAEQGAAILDMIDGAKTWSDLEAKRADLDWRIKVFRDVAIPVEQVTALTRLGVAVAHLAAAVNR